MMTASRGHQIVLDILATEHRELDTRFHRLDAAGSAHLHEDAIGEATRQALFALVRHMAAEEACLYPQVRALVPHGDLVADRELAEHFDAVKLIDELATLNVRHWLFAPTLSTLECHIRSHFAEEEARVFPAFADAVARPRAFELGARLSEAEHVLRNHPVRLNPTADDIRDIAEAIRAVPPAVPEWHR
jgi:hypothetical protein